MSRNITPRYSAPRSESGFSITEILVTMVVLSTGLLGAANLQVEALRGNHSAYLATVAAQQAQDMVERMNANPVGVAENRYDAMAAEIPEAEVDCQSDDCAPADLALYDHNRWNSANQAQLPNGAGQVSEVADGLFLIGVRWHDKMLAGANGWQVDTDAAAACGDPEANTRCFVLRYQS